MIVVLANVSSLNPDWFGTDFPNILKGSMPPNNLLITAASAR
jgi:hypothetical protein